MGRGGTRPYQDTGRNGLGPGNTFHSWETMGERLAYTRIFAASPSLEARPHLFPLPPERMAQAAATLFVSRCRNVCQRLFDVGQPIALEPGLALAGEEVPSQGPDVWGSQSEGWDVRAIPPPKALICPLQKENEIFRRQECLLSPALVLHKFVEERERKSGRMFGASGAQSYCRGRSL